MNRYQPPTQINLSRNNQIEWFALLSVMVLSLPILLNACGSGFGNIRVEDVDTSITDAQTAIQAAYFTSAAKYEPSTLNHAQSLLDDAKKAKKEKDGFEALRLAQEAKFEVELAVNRAQQRETMEEEIKTLKHEEQAEIETLKYSLQVAERESTRMKLDVQRLESRLERLESDKRELAMQVSEQQRSDWKAKQAENRVVELETQLNEIQSELHSALLKQRQSEKRAKEFSERLSRELTAALSQAAEAEKKSRSAQTKSSTRSKAYTDKISELERKNAREVALTKARKRAAELQAKKFQSGAESMVDFDEVRPIVMTWQDDWKSEQFDEHLSFYTADATVEKIFIRDGKEKRENQFNLQQLRLELSGEFSPDKWQFTRYNITQIPITYQFTRKSNRNTKSHDLWLRELWLRKENSEWKISYETWKIYEGVPRFR